MLAADILGCWYFLVKLDGQLNGESELYLNVDWTQRRVTEKSDTYSAAVLRNTIVFSDRARPNHNHFFQ